MRTPGTNLDWATLPGWLDCVDVLVERHRLSTRCYAQEDAHWVALAPFAKEWIAAADKATCERLLLVLGSQYRSRRGAWCKPERGWRAGQWADVHVEVKNRLWRLDREADRESMGQGHNAKAFA